MRTRGVAVVLVLSALAFAVPAGAQGLGSGCDISGTWFGGSEGQPPYQFTIWPIGAGRYGALAQPAIGVPARADGAWTNWTGELVKKGQRFDSYMIQFWVSAPTAEAPDGVAEIDAVHSRMQFIDCNTIKNTIDVYGVYVPYTPDVVPFVDPFDFDIMAWLAELGVTEIEETYHRMPVGILPPPSAARQAEQAATQPKALDRLKK
jgi:hypothetical protein